LQDNLSKLQYEKNELYDNLEKLENWINIKGEIIEEIDTKQLESRKEELMKKSLVLEEKISKIEEIAFDNQKINELEEQLGALKIEKEDLTKQSNKLNAWLEMKLESIGQFDLSFLNSRKIEITKEIEAIKEEQEQMSTHVVELENELSRSNITKDEVIEKVKAFNIELNELRTIGNKKIVKEVNDRLQKSLDDLADAEKEIDIEKIKSYLLQIKDELKKVLNFSTGREAQIKQEKINGELMLLADEKEGVIEKINSIRLEISTKNERLKLINSKQGQLTKELAETDSKLEKSQEKFDSSSVRNEIKEIEDKIIPIDKVLEKIKEAIAKIKSSKETERNSLFDLQRQLQEYRHETNKISNELNDYRISSARHETRVEDLENAIRKIGFEGDITSETIQKLKQELNEKIKTIDSQVALDREKLNQFNQEQEKKRNHLLSLQRNLQNLQNEVNILNNNLNELKINSTRHETRLEDLEVEIRESFGDLKRIKESRFEGEIEKGRVLDRIKKIKKQLDLIGGIDPEVEKEYNDTKERFDFLSGQSKDLNETIVSLKSIIKELDETIRVKFDKEFKIISHNFEKYFKILFNGGAAKIVKVMEQDKEKTEQEEEEKISQEKTAGMANMKRVKFLQKHNATGLAGIEIQATPPGKKIASITMLSGGERALTAIALICAIISANPSPFVVLDEVDAALDEANSERLAKILEELSHKTQFIAITHNRATMRRSAILYGVTMGDDGASQLLSIKLDDVVVK